MEIDPSFKRRILAEKISPEDKKKADDEVLNFIKDIKATDAELTNVKHQENKSG